MDINVISRQIHENARAKGFWDKERNVGEMLMLIVSEVSEAMEADRENKFYDPSSRYRVGKDLTVNGAKWAFDIVDSSDAAWCNWFRAEVKNTFEDELADAVIRIMDLAYSKNIDLESHILMKMRFNSMREHLHGKKY
jgi:NTP pyrophosphatase (non-canonical NTP hydrolase)